MPCNRGMTRRMATCGVQKPHSTPIPARPFYTIPSDLCLPHQRYGLCTPFLLFSGLLSNISFGSLFLAASPLTSSVVNRSSSRADKFSSLSSAAYLLLTSLAGYANMKHRLCTGIWVECFLRPSFNDMGP